MPWNAPDGTRTLSVLGPITTSAGVAFVVCAVLMAAFFAPIPGQGAVFGAILVAIPARIFHLPHTDSLKVVAAFWWCAIFLPTFVVRMIRIRSRTRSWWWWCTLIAVSALPPLLLCLLNMRLSSAVEWGLSVDREAIALASSNDEVRQFIAETPLRISVTSRTYHDRELLSLEVVVMGNNRYSVVNVKVNGSHVRPQLTIANIRNTDLRPRTPSSDESLKSVAE